MEYLNTNFMALFSTMPVIFSLLVIASFLPLFVAVFRSHRRALLIGILNLFIGVLNYLFFGAALLGWIFLLAWSLNKNVYPKNSEVIRARINEKRRKKKENNSTDNDSP